MASPCAGGDHRTVDKYPTANHVFIQGRLAAEMPGWRGRRYDSSSGAARMGCAAPMSRSSGSAPQRLYQNGDPSFVGPAWIAWMVMATDLWLDAVSVVQ